MKKINTGYCDKHGKEICVGDTMHFVIGEAPDRIFCTGKIVIDPKNGDPYVEVPDMYENNGYRYGGYYGALGHNNYSITDWEIVPHDTPLGSEYEGTEGIAVDFC